MCFQHLTHIFAKSGDVFLTQGSVFSRFLVGQTVGLFCAPIR